MGAAPAAEFGGRPAAVGRKCEEMIEEEEDGLGVLGDSKWWPPGFRFHPTDEELILYYLKRKVCRRRIKLAVVADLDVYKWEPWELPEKSALRSGDKQWYFFSPRDRKYPNGSRSNRATQHGYWKATGKDRTISQNSSAVGNKKTLVFYHGRAPKGQRTDWVMHEYTLDEQMLATFNNVQDSYALYKVFRKSGPGPKNGEQYGAPFREEEWDDDAGDDDLRSQINREDPPAELPFCDSVARVLGDEDRSNLPNYDLEDLLLQMPSDPEIIQQHSKHPAFVHEVNIESEVGSDILGPTSYIDVDFTQHSWSKQDGGKTSFELSPSASAAYMQPVEMPEVTSLTSFSEQSQLKADEEFLEIKDFNDPESAVWSLDDISNNDLIPGTNEFYDPYEYFDAQMYLAEALGPNNGTAPDLYLNGFADDETYSEASHITTELWTREQASNALTPEESNQVMKTYRASSGEVHAGGRLSDLGGGDGSVASPSDSWFSSALSAFLDSVPSSPAIASENALLSRALERVSSFRAGQIRGGGNPSAATGDGAADGRRRVSHNRGFLFISFLGVVVAILWALAIGATVKVIKGFWGKFTSS